MSSKDADNTTEYASLAEELVAKSTAGAKQKSEVNLLAKAVAILSRRECSEKELRQRLQRYTDDMGAINAVVSRLQRENWQSDERFVESFVQSREQRWGNQKIFHALSQHDLDSEQLSELKEELKDSEYQRAREVWIRRFGDKYGVSLYDTETSGDDEFLSETEQQSFEEQAKEKAKQLRFLASRGFSADVVYKVVNSRGAPEED
ncbi:Regulatory protein recX [Oligella ureolytica]|uniref:Regulatory protein RecX n=1 Tax=Oligella ureolytica TaxID=90244 RepID=A0A378XHI8_9BURK|nr:regulatory protein RecX [Oligella ureolytica]QPT39902.1 regulatory protein RecX [Oligella ureolytica]SUA51939.1 Regulatory protein recX [Oligella ureolytica]SUA57933.1 Regulatory protein recX [Oligella ureolytica]